MGKFLHIKDRKLRQAYPRIWGGKIDLAKAAIFEVVVSRYELAAILDVFAFSIPALLFIFHDKAFLADLDILIIRQHAQLEAIAEFYDVV